MEGSSYQLRQGLPFSYVQPENAPVAGLAPDGFRFGQTPCGWCSLRSPSQRDGAAWPHARKMRCEQPGLCSSSVGCGIPGAALSSAIASSQAQSSGS